MTGRFNLVKVMLFAVLAAGLSAGLASAQDVHGKFALPFEARWGTAVLPPGDYTFGVSSTSGTHIVAIRQGNRGVALVVSGRDASGEISGPSALVATRTDGEYRISALRLAEVGLTLEYTAPKVERPILAQAPVLIQRVPISMASR
jgi:hypothetical protein